MIHLRIKNKDRYLTIRQKIVGFLTGNKTFIMYIFLAALLTLLRFQIPQNGLIGSYYDNPEWRGEPVFTHIEQQASLETYEVVSDSFNFPSENISISWNGWIRIDQERVYRFSTLSDDGSSIIINGEIVVDNGGYHGPKQASGEIFLSTGMHQININYFNGAGGDGFSAFWIDQTGEQAEIPPDILFSKNFPPFLLFLSKCPKIVTYICITVWILLLLTFVLDINGNVRGHHSKIRYNVVFGSIIHIIFVLSAVVTIISNSSRPSPFPENFLPPLMEADYLCQFHGHFIGLQKRLSSLLAGGTRVWIGDPKAFGKDTITKKLFSSWQLGDSGKLLENPTALFYAAIRYLYDGSTLYLPQNDTFSSDEIKNEGGIAEVHYYQPYDRLTPSEVEIFNAHRYHRFLYNPYMYNPKYKCNQYFVKDNRVIKDKSIDCPQIESGTQPIFIVLVAPNQKHHSKCSDVFVVSFENNLYFVPKHLLPERLQGVHHE